MSTLGRVHAATWLRGGEAWEVWVVDNGSTDGSADAVHARFPEVKLIRRPTNEGTAARSHAFGVARGEYLILLDDDSYPLGDTARRSVEWMDAHPEAGAVVGRVVLSDGSEEACALPSVMLSGAVCIRRNVLQQVGGFRPEFFRKAGEYDLSFRIWAAGFRVERFEDLLYGHDKVPAGRSAELAHFMDLRNNLILVERFFDKPMRRAYRKDYLHRYAALARHEGCGETVSRAIAEARDWAKREREAGRQTLPPDVLEIVNPWQAQQRRVAAWAQQHGVRTVVIADYAKNLYATWRAARLAGLEVLALAADSQAFRGQRYRGLPIERHDTALSRGPGGVIVANINPAQVKRCAARVAEFFSGPVLTLWSGRRMGEVAGQPTGCVR